MRLSQILFTQGFGSRRECEQRVVARTVAIAGDVMDDPSVDVDTTGLTLTVDGVPWPYMAHATVMLHKPAGYECSAKPSRYPSVLDLLPMPLRRRGVQPVGRLDADTTGLLLLTDDGALSHRLTSPRHHVAKVYVVRTRHAVTEAMAAALLQGVMLRDDPHAARALACSIVAPTCVELTIDEGRYHQVKRMIAAVGNRVEALHRTAVGDWRLPDDLGVGQWCWGTPVLSPQDGLQTPR